ncbi:hypothetical protein O181_052992 [Austropuccinia psidii MF-1]|uniref:Integrase catalytic domain-containing protein n=1 Tax=Austropuccinia psidii MF-1 TaxID=1389203 RepID=A0A9Q3E422_9BASI|nr:hypothetical protein [Austropuccinia psidii MF-1]
MTIVDKARNICKNADGLSRWALANTPDNPSYVLLEEESQIPIEGINITDTGTKFFEEVRKSYKQDRNFHIMTCLLDKDCKDTVLASSLDELPFSTAYHPETDGMAERMIQTLEDMIKRFCAYELEFKDLDGFTHEWCTLIPALDLAYKTSVYSSTG